MQEAVPPATKILVALTRGALSAEERHRITRKFLEGEDRARVNLAEAEARTTNLTGGARKVNLVCQQG
jgi:hypothetical protein